MTEPHRQRVGPTTRGSLVRGLGLITATSVILANIIGTGVFVKARVMTCNVGTPGMVLTVWLVAGLLSLVGAMVYAELGVMMPRSGGEVYFIGAAFGRLWAFLHGWTKTLALGASIAATAIITIVFLNDLLGGALPPPALTWLPPALIAVLIAINLASIRTGGLVAAALTAVKVALVLGVGVGAFLLADGSWAHFGESGAAGVCEGVPETAKLGIRGFGAAMLGALWSYNGWQLTAFVGGEIRDPKRNIPRSLVGGTVLVIALYLVINAAYYYALSPAEVAGLPESLSVAGEAARRFLGPAAAAVMSMGLMISALGTTHTTLLSGARVPYAVAHQGLLPASLGRVSHRGTPVAGVVCLGVWSLVLTLSGTFDILTDIYIFVLWIFFGMTGLSLFVLRRTRPEVERPYRVPGYPVVPALFVLVTVFLLLNTFVATPWRALAGLALVLAGLPVYAYFAKRAGDVPIDWLGAEDDAR